MSQSVHCIKFLKRKKKKIERFHTWFLLNTSQWYKVTLSGLVFVFIIVSLLFRNYTAFHLWHITEVSKNPTKIYLIPDKTNVVGTYQVLKFLFLLEHVSVHILNILYYESLVSWPGENRHWLTALTAKASALVHQSPSWVLSFIVLLLFFIPKPDCHTPLNTSA